MEKTGKMKKAGSLFLAMSLAAAAIVVALPMTVSAQTSGPTWTTSKIEAYNSYDYELWNQENKGNVSMKLTGDNGTVTNAVGGTFEATWSSTINVLFRSGRKFTGTSGTSGQTHKQIGNMSINFAATWNSGDNVKMLGIYGWAFYASGSVPNKQENGTSSTFSNQIEYYIIQDRGSYNAASSGTNAKKYGSATIDGIAYDFWVCDRIGQAMLTGNGNFKQYFSVPQNTSAHRQSGTVSVSKHFEEWEKLGMKMDGPLYEVAMKVESYTGSAQNSNGSAKVTKNILTIGAANQTTYTITFNPNNGTVSPTSGTTGTDGKIANLPTPTRSNYTFNGWFTAATGGTAVNTSTVFTSNTTIYAQWTAVATTYTITFNANSGTVSPTSGTTGTDGKIASLPTPTRSNYTFNGWFTAATGGTAVNTSTVFTSNTTIYAQWTASYALTTTASPTAGGTISRNPDSTSYGSGRNVTLTATANSGYTFSGWSGDATGSTNPLTVTMNAAKNITATFTAIKYTLTAVASPTAGGTVTRNPDSSSYGSGRNVTLTATANSGYTFSSWSGDVGGDALVVTNPLTLTVIMNANKNITAIFVPVVPGKFVLTALSSPAAGGTITALPLPSAADGTYDSAKVVKLTAVAANGYKFDGFSGGITATTDTVSIVMNANKSVTANFTAIAPSKFILTVTISLPGGGTVNFMPAPSNIAMPLQPGVDGGAYDSAQVVKLTATAADGYKFDGFSGSVTAVTDTVSIVMNANKNVTVNFALVDPTVVKNGVLNRRGITGLTVRQASNSALNVSFTAKTTGSATVKLYSLKGNLVSSAKLQTLAGGNYSHTFNAAKLSTGFYVVKVSGNGFTEQTRVVIPK